jgi:hypothetical protein
MTNEKPTPSPDAAPEVDASDPKSASASVCPLGSERRDHFAAMAMSGLLANHGTMALAQGIMDGSIRVGFEVAPMAHQPAGEG